MKVVETFEVVRKFLGWSYQEVSVKSGKYSPEYLKQVHQARPFPEVEKNLIMIYVHGLAERAVHLVFGGQITSDLRDKLTARFAQIVRQNSLSLEYAWLLVEKVSQDKVSKANYRPGTVDAVRVETAWEDVLASIVLDLNKLQQGRLLDGSDETKHGSTHFSLVSKVPALSYQTKRDYQAILAECNFCHKPLPENRDSKHTCGYRNDDYL